MTATTATSPVNKVTAHWVRKVINRRLQKIGILDTGATSGAAPEEDEDAFEDTGKLSKKTFMFPDKRTSKAMKKMRLKHKLCPAAREMNIVPGLHSTLVSIPKLVDTGYTTVFSRKGVAIYDDHTTTITANKPPVLEANRYNLTGLWKLPLHPEGIAANGEPQQDEVIHVIFDLPSTRQNFLGYHAVAGFPPKETFIRAVCNGNYAMWPKLTIQLIHKYMPDLDETAKGHLKGQRQGVRSTKQKAFEKMIKVEEARIKIKGESSPFRPLPPAKLNDIFVLVEDLNKEIHTNQTGAFPHTFQRGNCYIMLAIHLDASYIFAEPMKNRMEGEMIRVYQKILNRMKAAGLGLRKQVLDNECSAAMKACIKENGMDYELVPPGQHRHNQAEQAIQTFKAHFISILAGVDNKFPLLLWCHLLKTTELTLNLLRQSRVAPKIFVFLCTSTAPTTTCKNRSPQSDVRSKRTSSPMTICHGTEDRNQVSTWAHLWNTTNVSRYM
jgi:hypothetical protein